MPVTTKQALTTSSNSRGALPLAPDMTTLYARRGYYESMMNTTDWVWNAHLSRSLMKGALVVKLTGFDLLHQLTNTRYEMNAQGRTEVWYNSLPRYMMLTGVEVQCQHQNGKKKRREKMETYLLFLGQFIRCPVICPRNRSRNHPVELLI